jgi:hypothetical protein
MCRAFARRAAHRVCQACWPDARAARRQQRGDLFEQRPIAFAEGRGDVAVDVDFAEDLAVPHDRHHDLGLRLQTARQVPRIRMDVVDDDGRLFGRRGAADATAQRDPRVR